jgi:hypothetical protein
MADITAQGKFNKKNADGSWKYQKTGGDPKKGYEMTKKWDSTTKTTSDTTKTDTTKPINNEQGRLRIKNMLESKTKKV